MAEVVDKDAHYKALGKSKNPAYDHYQWQKKAAWELACRINRCCDRSNVRARYWEKNGELRVYLDSPNHSAGYVKVSLNSFWFSNPSGISDPNLGRVVNEVSEEYFIPYWHSDRRVFY